MNKRTSASVAIAAGITASMLVGGLSANGASGPYVADVSPNLTNPVLLIDPHEMRAGIWKNFQKVVAGCMLAKGYSYRQAPPPPASSSAQYFPSSDSLDVTPDFNSATSATYEMAPASASTQGVTETSARGYMTALRGVSLPAGGESRTNDYDWRAYDGASLPNFGTSYRDTGGCEAEGRRLVTAPAISAMRQVDALAAPLLEPLMSGADGRLTDWQTCMAGRGHEFHSIFEPSSKLREMAHWQLEPADPEPGIPGPTRTPTTTAHAAASSVTQTTSVASTEEQVASDFVSCMDSSGMTSFIETEVAQEWDSFKAQHLELLERAGGKTGAQGGVS